MPENAWKNEKGHKFRLAQTINRKVLAQDFIFNDFDIRAMAEELRSERGRLPESSNKSEFARNLFMISKRCQSNPKVYGNK